MKKILITFMVICLSVLANATNKTIDQILKEKTKEINNIKLELAKAEEERVNWETSLVIYQHYARAGTIEKNNITADSLYNIEYCLRKYKYLASHYNFDTFNPIIFANMWISAESSFNTSPNCSYTNKAGEAKGTVDKWVMQMNQCHYLEPIPSKNLWRIADRLFPYLYDRPDSDPEKNIVVWYLWLDKQSESTGYGVWQLYTKWERGIKGKLKPRPDVIELYGKLKRIK